MSEETIAFVEAKLVRIVELLEAILEALPNTDSEGHIGVHDRGSYD